MHWRRCCTYNATNGSDSNALLPSSIQSGQIIGYYLLWADDVHGAWIPFTKPTDEEIVWVGYDSTQRADRRLDVLAWQGSPCRLARPRNCRDRRAVGKARLNAARHRRRRRHSGRGTLTNFWVSSWIGLPDIWLGRLSRRGPLCFCHGYRRYRTFDRPILTGDRIDVVARLEDPDAVLSAVFGTPVLAQDAVALRETPIIAIRRRKRCLPRIDAHFLLETAHSADLYGVP